MEEKTGYHPLPQPHELSEREKEDAMGAYLMMFAAVGAGLPLPVINLIAAIIYYYINRGKSLFIHFHSLQSLLSQIPTTVINWGIVYIGVRYFFYDDPYTEIHKGYILMAILANLIYFIFSIIAGVKARKGKFYYFLFFGKYAYEQVFSLSNTRSYGDKSPDTNTEVNKPPL